MVKKEQSEEACHGRVPFQMTFLDKIWLIPLLPAAGALIQLLIGRKLSKRAVSLVSVGSPGTFLCVGGWVLLRAAAPARPDLRYGPLLLATSRTLSSFGRRPSSLNVSAGIRLDQLSAVMMLMVTGVGFLIHVYSSATWPTRAATTGFSAT